MKNIMDSIVDIDSPFSFCGGGGLAMKILLALPIFKKGRE